MRRDITIGHTESNRGMLIISDLFGWNTGRTRQYADFFADLGYYVAVPGLLTVSQNQPHNEDRCKHTSKFK
ncbi:hypothetical protein EON65_17540 [archaeon]|nr:MAG: hypothetical protein EON65_17540 [archaeon]